MDLRYAFLIAIILILIYFDIFQLNVLFLSIISILILQLIDNNSITDILGGGLEGTMTAPIKYQNECSISKFTRILTPDWPKMPYRRRRDEFKPQLHWGQRKLLDSEIEFLTLITDPSKHYIVVYAGAADGKHDIYLAGLFPNCEFHLVDPARFDKNLIEFSKTHDNIKIFNEYFTDEFAGRYTGRENVLFISDIRTVPDDIKQLYIDNEPGRETEKVIEWGEELEENVIENMNWQRDWIEIIQPAAFMVKFRLPYKPGKTEYFNGDIYFQVWAGNTSSESRLIARRPYKMKQYDNTDYEQSMFRLNYCERASEFKDIEIKMPAPIPNNYDVYGEQYILKEYIEKFRGVDGFPKINSLAEMLGDIDKALGMPLKNKYITQKEKERKDREKR